MMNKPDEALPKPPPPQRKRLQPSEKELKQQSTRNPHHPPQRQRSFQQTQTIMAGLYDLEETLGKGHFATVKAAKHVFTGERVAVKVIDKTKLDTISQKALLKEVLCMKLVQHPNVVKLYEVIDTSSKMYLVLELGQGDLYDLIQRQQGGLSEPQARVYFKQIVKAVSYCHKLHVAHRDLKPENVVFFPHQKPQQTAPPPKPTPHHPFGQLKLTDFGFSNKFCPGVKLETSCGSLAYSAPEILLGDSYDAPAVDIWSLGVILYMLVCGRAPFQEANDSETLTMIMDVKYIIPEPLSPQLKDLIRRMLVRDPRRRARLPEIETHDWVKIKDEYDEDDDDTDDDVECYYYSTDDSASSHHHHHNSLTNNNKLVLPLIASNTLTEQESERIIGEMVKGGIVSAVEEVKSSLQSNAYNHITSTYYLLAERFLRERALRRRLSTKQPTTPEQTTPETLPPSKSPETTPEQPEDEQSKLTIQFQKRKNSHQFEDVVLPSIASADPSSSKDDKSFYEETKTIASLDLETSSSRTVHHHHRSTYTKSSKQESKFKSTTDQEDRSTTPTTTTSSSSSRNNSPHHPHYYHHLGKRISTPPSSSQQPESPDSSSPPPHCSSKLNRMKPHHSHSDSSDDGCGTNTTNNVVNPTISVSEAKQDDSNNTTTSTTSCKTTNLSVANNNVFLNPSPSYEGLVQEVDDEKSKRRKKKSRILFLSWFFNKKKSSGSKSTSSSSSGGANGIYKTRSCAELKMRGVSKEDELSTRECFGVCNGGVNNK